jgi:hypothetical protein
MAAYFLSLALAASALDAPEWVDRERATATLRQAGVAAVPVLWPLQRSESPEVRQRVSSLLRPAFASLGDSWAVRTWFARDVSPRELAELHQDGPTRRRLAVSGRRLGLLSESQAARLEAGDTDIVACVFFGQLWYQDTADAIAAARDAYTAPAPREAR